MCLINQDMPLSSMPDQHKSSSYSTTVADSFLDHTVSVKENPSAIIKNSKKHNQAKINCQASQTSIATEPSSFVDNPTHIKIQKYSNFRNENEILDYFFNLIYEIYPNYNFQQFINNQKKIALKSRFLYVNKKLYEILTKLTTFASISCATCYCNIADAFGYFIDGQHNNHSINEGLKNFFNSINLEQVEQMARNKDLYKYIRVQGKSNYITLKKLTAFSNKRQGNYNKVKDRIHKNIDRDCIDTRKKLVTKYSINIIDICIKKDIDIDDKLLFIIKLLASSNKLTDANVKQILKKIKCYFLAIGNENLFIDTSILTDIICLNDGKTNEQLLLSMANITDRQINNIIRLQKKIEFIIKHWRAKGFPITEIIDSYIKKYQVDHTGKKTDTQEQSVFASKATNINTKVVNLTTDNMEITTKELPSEHLDNPQKTNILNFVYNNEIDEILNRNNEEFNFLLDDNDAPLLSQDIANELSKDIQKNNEETETLNLSDFEYDFLLNDNNSSFTNEEVVEEFLEDIQKNNAETETLNFSDLEYDFPLDENYFCSGISTNELKTNKRSIDYTDNNSYKKIKYS